MSTLSEEKLSTIIQQRLALKDTQLKRFISKYLDILINFDKNPDQSLDVSVKEVLQELEMLEFQIVKAEMAHYIRLKDQSYYKQMNEEVLREIGKVKEEIREKERVLELEVEKKKIRAEYDLIAEEIIRYDEKKSMRDRLENVETEIKELEKNYNQNIHLIESKEKELFLILAALNEFQSINLSQG